MIVEKQMYLRIKAQKRNEKCILPWNRYGIFQYGGARFGTVEPYLNDQLCFLGMLVVYKLAIVQTKLPAKSFFYPLLYGVDLGGWTNEKQQYKALRRPVS